MQYSASYVQQRAHGRPARGARMARRRGVHGRPALQSRTSYIYIACDQALLLRELENCEEEEAWIRGYSYIIQKISLKITRD